MIFIPWECHTCKQWILILSPPLTSALTPPGSTAHPFQHRSLYSVITKWIQINIQMMGHHLGAWWTYQNPLSSKKSDFPFPSSQHISVPPQLGVRTWELLVYPTLACWLDGSCIGLIQAGTAVVSSWTQWSCPVQKALVYPDFWLLRFSTPSSAVLPGPWKERVILNELSIWNQL